MLDSSGLIKLINNHGIEIINTKKRCESLLRDYCVGASEKHINLLILSLRDKIASTIIETIKDGSYEVKKNKIIENLQNNYGVSKEGAEWVFTTWVHGLIPKVIIIDLGKGIKNEMVFIPAGKFMMGSPKFEEGRRDNETYHEVTLTKQFYIGKYTVTQEQWEAIMGNNPSSNKGTRLPVTNISWYECQEFIKKLNEKQNNSYRLPTEAEWEYACKAGTITPYSFGDKITPEDANYADSKIGKPIEVGNYKPNAFGLFDMHGNVWEWCMNSYYSYSRIPVKDPKGPSEGSMIVCRGGSFESKEKTFLRSSVRYDFQKNTRTDSIGFRLIKSLCGFH